MSLTPKQIDDMMPAGAQRLLARAEDARSLNHEAVSKRLRAATGKYVLKDDAGKTYDIDHQTDVAKFEGKRVRVQGTLDSNGKIMVK